MNNIYKPTKSCTFSKIIQISKYGNKINREIITKMQKNLKISIDNLQILIYTYIQIKDLLKKQLT